MPLHTTVDIDPITHLVRFQTSSVFETLISLQSLNYQLHQKEWTEEVKRNLGDFFVERVRLLYNDFHKGSDSGELAIDFSDHNDVSGVIDYVEGMSLKKFAFYFSGRLYPQSDVCL